VELLSLDPGVSLRQYLGHQITTKRRFNLETGFYPFVFERGTGICIAHGQNATFVNLTIVDIVKQYGIGFVDAAALQQRFELASSSTDDSFAHWVRYLWNDGGRPNSKLAYIVPIGNTTEYYLGVGYENTQLPPDLPCSAHYDSWCSITNVPSLIGAAQSRLLLAESLASFEAAAFDLSFDPAFSIADGFYPFLFNYKGPLVAHGRRHDSLGLNLSTIVVQQGINTAEAGWELHNTSIRAAEGQGSGWYQYQWRNKLNEPLYSKISYAVKIVFEGEQYFLGAGFTLAMHEDQDKEACTDNYSLPCAFQASLQLSSHALSHVISDASSSIETTFAVLTSDQSLRRGDFYVFAYDFNGTCVAHGGNSSCKLMNSECALLLTLLNTYPTSGIISCWFDARASI
jgi:hypothetical protein